MKKILLFSALLLQMDLFGQAVINGGFENWNATSYNDLNNGWNTANLRDLQTMNVASITKVAGFTGFAVRLQTTVVGPDTTNSYILNTSNPCNNPNQWVGGVPYTQQPTAITGKYRYNLPVNDTALLIVIFRKNGVHVGDNIIKIRGTGSQPTFASFSFPLICTVVPDTMIIAAACSNKLTNVEVQNGSFLELDNLAFTNCVQPIPDGDFEGWTAKAYDVIANWKTQGQLATISNTSYSGSFAVRLETGTGGCGNNNIFPSQITSGYYPQNNGPRGGRPYTGQLDTLCGYYKYSTPGIDTAQINVTLSLNANPIGGGNKYLLPAATYTLFKVPYMSGSIPDTIRIDAQSSNWNSGVIGSVLYLDNLGNYIPFYTKLFGLV